MRTNEETVLTGPDSFMTVRRLTIHGTNFQIGRRIGEIAIGRYGTSLAQHVGDPLYARARRLYLQRNYPVQWERVRGVAAALGVEADDDRYDLSTLWYNLDLPGQMKMPISPPEQGAASAFRAMESPGCSVVYYPPSTTSTDHGYLSRNYDFSTGAMADVMSIPVPPEAKAQMPAVMSEPYIMEWYPEDGGYASIAIHAFDILSGTLDGINSAGLVVSILADDEGIAELGPKLEIHPGPPRITGIHELQVMRFVLDNCATVEDAKEALLVAKQYYTFVPNHYIIADKEGNSFIFENSLGRNAQYIFDGSRADRRRPQVVTNFELYKHPTIDDMPGGPLTPETNAFWRYRTLVDRINGTIEAGEFFTQDSIKANNNCANILSMLQTMSTGPTYQSIAANMRARTLWHSLYDQQGKSVEFSFYLGEKAQSNGPLIEHRSDYLQFALEN